MRCASSVRALGTRWRDRRGDRWPVPSSPFGGGLGLRRADHRPPPHPQHAGPRSSRAAPAPRGLGGAVPASGRGGALLEAVANDTGTPAGMWRRHRAEQDLLLVRLAADTGARRGELAALQFADLEGRTLQIRRSVSGDAITLPKSGHARTLYRPAGMAESAQAPSRGPTCGSCKKTRSTVTVAARTGRRWWRARTRVLAR
jgi:hypothetical protein